MADNTYQYRLVGLDVLERLAQRAPDVFDAEMGKFFEWALSLLKSEVVERTPNADGALRESVFARVDVSATGMLGVIGTTLNYAPAVEFGTKPHPVSEAGILAIADWARRKLPLGQAPGKRAAPGSLDAEALRVAHAIAWKIRAKGSQGAFMFRDAFAANSARVLSRWSAMVQRAVQHLGSA